MRCYNPYKIPIFYKYYLRTRDILYVATCNVNTTLNCPRIIVIPNKVRNFQWNRPSQSLLVPRNRTARPYRAHIAKRIKR